MVARQKLFTYQVTYSIPGISSSKITQKTSVRRHKSSYNIERFKEPSFLLLLQNYIKFRSNFRIPRNSFTCHWIRIASIVLCLDLQSLPTHVSEADQSCGVFWTLAKISYLCGILLLFNDSIVSSGPDSSSSNTFHTNPLWRYEL